MLEGVGVDICPLPTPVFLHPPRPLHRPKIFYNFPSPLGAGPTTTIHEKREALKLPFSCGNYPTVA